MTEAPVRRLTRRRVLVLFAIVALVSELAATAVVIGVSRAHGNRLDFVQSRLWLTRLAYTSPVERHSRARFAGYLAVPGVQRALTRADPILGWRLAPGVGVITYSDNGRAVGWGVTNDQGFASAGEVDVHHAVPKPAGTYRVIVVGGSTVEGVVIGPSPADSLPAHIARALVPGVGARARLEVINAGVAGYYSAQELLYLETELMAYQPDLVIVYDGWNETRSNAEYDAGARDRWQRFRRFYDALGERLDGTYRVVSSLAHALTALAHRAHELADCTALFFLARRAFESWAPAFAQTPALPLTAAKQHHAETVRHWIANLERMCDVVRAAGVPVAFAFQPVLGMAPKPPAGPEATYLTDYKELMRVRAAFYADARPAFARFAAARSKAGEVCAADLSDVFAGVRERMYEDSGHLMPEGNRRVAQALVERLTSSSVIRLPRSQK